MSRNISILLFGATGYIGGAVLAKLLAHSNLDAFSITVYLRNAEKAKIIQERFNVQAVVGTHQEYAKVSNLVENAQMVFQLADSDDLHFNKAVVSGLKSRHNKTGDVPILIHTSGTGVLRDDARGEYATSTIYSDLNVEQLKSIPPTAVHRQVDLLVIDADLQGFARTHIAIPSVIYGIATHPLVAAGVSNARSIMVPLIISASIGRKQAGMVGKGKSYWPHVHINDCADMYMILFDSIMARPEETGHGWQGVYFGENGEFTWYELGKAIGDALVMLGVSSDPEPTPFTPEDFRAYFKIGSLDPETAGWYFGTNSRCRGERLRSLGWKPKYTTEDFIKSILPEVQALLKQN